MGRDTILVVVLLVVAGLAAAGFFILKGGDNEADIDTPATAPVANEDATAAPKGGAIRRTTLPNADAKGATAASGNPLVVGVDQPTSQTTGEAPTTVFGEVTNADNKPIENAMVSVCEDVSDMPAHTLQGQVHGTATTDRQGRFWIRPLDHELRYVLRVDHEEYATKTMPVTDLTRGEQRAMSVRVGGGMSVTGSITDMQGAAISGAEIAIYDQQARSIDPEDSIERRIPCDAQGNFEIRNINAGFKRVTARAPGYSTQTNPSVFLQDGKPSVPLAFKLDTGGEISGVVKDPKSGPLEGVLISAEPIARSGNLVTNNYPTIKSRADGTFTYDGLKQGVYILTCHKKGYLNTGVRKTLKVGDKDVEIEMERNPVISGQVVDADTGAPVTRFTVELSRTEFLVFSSNRLQQRFESPEGRFEYGADQNSGEIFLQANAPGYAGGRSEKISLVAQQDVSNIVIRLGRGAKVNGRVTSTAGAAIGGAQVELMPLANDGPPNPFLDLVQNSMRTAKKAAVTDAQGNYTFTGVREGKYKVRASHPSYAMAESDDIISVGAIGESQAPTLQLMQGGTLKGIVYNKEKKPEAGTRVQLTENGKFGNAGGYTAITNAEGRFEIRNIRPALYKVMLADRGGQPNTNFFEQLLQGKKPQEYLIEDGAVLEIELE